jgi:glycosyltransferase involved in cell wall biosynthesis
MHPKVSVVLPVYNAGLYVKEAIDSIINQSFKDFELLIFNDGSTDNSLEIIHKFEDSRIRIVNYEKNIGLIQLLNNAFSEAKGEYIARMDADDISFPKRFEKQVAFLDQHPDHGVVGTQMEFIGSEEIIKKPCQDEEIRWWIFKGSPLAHPSVMIRKLILEQHQLNFKKEAYVVEDFDLWWRMAFHTKLANLKSVELKYRLHPQQESSSKTEIQLSNFVKSQKEFTEKLGLSSEKYPPDFINNILSRALDGTSSNLEKLWNFYQDLLNSKSGVQFFGLDNVLMQRELQTVFMLKSLTRYSWQLLPMSFNQDFKNCIQKSGNNLSSFIIKSIIQWKTKTKG